jgi:methanogenic corrinoid protein MtbC1
MIEDRLLKGDEAGAFAVVESALASWATPGDVLTELVAPAMAHIGDRWKSKEITIADEHQAAGVAIRIIGRLGPRFAHRGRHRGTVVVGAPAGDRHGIPSAIVADLLREVGFKVVDLGADTPPAAFATAAADADRLLAVGIGSTLPGNSRAVSAATSALHRVRPDVPVIVGGAAVPSEQLARRLGADFWSGTEGRSIVQLVLNEAAHRRTTRRAGAE